MPPVSEVSATRKRLRRGFAELYSVTSQCPLEAAYSFRPGEHRLPACDLQSMPLAGHLLERPCRIIPANQLTALCALRCASGLDHFLGYSSPRRASREHWPTTPRGMHLASVSAPCLRSGICSASFCGRSQTQRNYKAFRTNLEVIGGPRKGRWRRERDSNPRSACALNGFRDRPIQPL